jgi:hypothetical protein
MQRPHRLRHLRPDTGRAGRYDAEHLTSTGSPRTATLTSRNSFE